MNEQQKGVLRKRYESQRRGSKELATMIEQSKRRYSTNPSEAMNDVRRNLGEQHKAHLMILNNINKSITDLQRRIESENLSEEQQLSLIEKRNSLIYESIYATNLLIENLSKLMIVTTNQDYLVKATDHEHIKKIIDDSLPENLGLISPEKFEQYQEFALKSTAMNMRFKSYEVEINRFFDDRSKLNNFVNRMVEDNIIDESYAGKLGKIIEASEGLRDTVTSENKNVQSLHVELENALKKEADLSQKLLLANTPEEKKRLGDTLSQLNSLIHNLSAKLEDSTGLSQKDYLQKQRDIHSVVKIQAFIKKVDRAKAGNNAEELSKARNEALSKIKSIAEKLEGHQKNLSDELGKATEETRPAIIAELKIIGRAIQQSIVATAVINSPLSSKDFDEQQKKQAQPATNLEKRQSK